jgi:hypothetical protein
MTSPTIVSSQPAIPAASNAAPAAAPQQAGSGAPPAAGDAAALKAEIDALKGQVSEQQRTAQFWYEKATKPGAGGQGPGDKTPAPEPEDTTDLLDLITTQGPKGLNAYLKKQGLVSRDQVEAMVNTKAAQLAKETELVGRYADLKDQNSDFFKATAAEYGELVKGGVPQHLAMEMAAERAELRGIRSGKLKTPAQQTEEAKAQKEADRLARIKAQGGDRGNRAPAETEDDDVLSDNDRAAVKQLAEALDISVEDAEKRYVARAKQGVNVGLRLDRRR